MKAPLRLPKKGQGRGNTKEETIVFLPEEAGPGRLRVITTLRRRLVNEKSVRGDV